MTRSHLAKIEKFTLKIQSQFRSKFIIQSKFCAFWIIRSAFKVIRRQRVIVYQSQSPIIHEIERKFSHEKISENRHEFSPIGSFPYRFVPNLAKLLFVSDRKVNNSICHGGHFSNYLLTDENKNDDRVLSINKRTV